jgi:DNA polymerase family A
MIVSGDFETYYDRDYSLSRMSVAEYILDPRFEAIMLGLKLGSGPTRTYVGRERIAEALAGIGDWSSVAWLSHNTRFDGAILAWRFGYVPQLYLDTLSMSRATTHWNIGRSSLKAVSDYLGLPPKGDEVVRALGKRLADFTADEMCAYRVYCARDNDNCYDIFQTMRRCFTGVELQLIDLVLRMFILPQVQLDAAVLADHLDAVQAEKAAILAEVEATVDKSVFSSNVKFAALLAEHGVEVPLKRSATTDEFIPAIAKNDWAFKELCADETQPPFVQALLAARLSVKSTIEETRTRHLLRLARTSWPTQGMGWGPVPLKFSGARTHRLSGDDGTNWQNLVRGSPIRRGILAPPGCRILHRDSKQIEARMVAWLAQCRLLIDAFAEGRDVYCEFATDVYGRLITPDDTKERFVGKTGILSLDYGASGERFRHMLFIGNGGVSVKIPLEEANYIVALFRQRHPEIPELWRVMDALLEQIVNTRSLMGDVARARALPVLDRLPIAADHDSILLPSGLKISYPNIRHYRSGDRREIRYDDPYGGAMKLYGAKALENVSQALSRIVTTDTGVRVYRQTGYHPFLSTHDSLDYCVPASEVEAMDALLDREFAVVPAWAEGLPLASEGGWGVTLLDAEKKVNQ